MRLIETVNTCRRLLRHAENSRGHPCEPGWVGREGASQHRTHRLHLGVVLGVLFFTGRRHGACLFCLDSFVDEERRVAAIVENHRRPVMTVPRENAVGVIPVFGQRLALDGKHRHAVGRRIGAGANNDGCGRFVLSRKDVARRPPHLGAQRRERLNEHSSLHSHVERTGNASTAQWLRIAVLRTQCHETWHLDLGEANLDATRGCESEICDNVVDGVTIGGHVELRSAVERRTSGST